METSPATGTPAFVREDAGFESSGVRCAAWVYRPAGAAAQPSSAVRPVVVMAHGFGGDRRTRLPAFAERFAAAGYVVVLFDYRTFGDSDGRPRRLLKIRRQHEDWRSAVAFARSLPGVDADRVVLWGTSLSGGHVLRVGAQDARVAAVVAQVPHVDGLASALALRPAASLALGVRAVADLALAAVGRGPHYVSAIGAPRSGAVLQSADALPGWQAMVEQSPEHVPVAGIVAARVSLAMPFYSPGRSVRRLSCPVLVQIATDDVVTPPEAGRKVAGRILDARVLEYAGGHFDPYVPPLFEQVVGDQVAFLAEKVPAPVV
jgi:pimeloyl-ACP methyl ester carboxylesterase